MSAPITQRPQGRRRPKKNPGQATDGTQTAADIPKPTADTDPPKAPAAPTKAAAPAKLRKCKFHRRGICAKGNDCLFAHDDPNELNDSPARSLSNTVCAKVCEELPSNNSLCTMDVIGEEEEHKAPASSGSLGSSGSNPSSEGSSAQFNTDAFNAQSTPTASGNSGNSGNSGSSEQASNAVKTPGLSEHARNYLMELNYLNPPMNTKLCRTLVTTGACDDQFCTYAHTRDELQPELCGINDAEFQMLNEMEKHPISGISELSLFARAVHMADGIDQTELQRSEFLKAYNVRAAYQQLYLRIFTSLPRLCPPLPVVQQLPQFPSTDCH